MNPTLVRIQSHTTELDQLKNYEIITEAVCPCNRPLLGWSDCRQKHPFCARAQGGVSDRNSESSCRGEEKSPGCVAQPVAFHVGRRQPTLSYISGPVPWKSSPTRGEDVNSTLGQTWVNTRWMLWPNSTFLDASGEPVAREHLTDSINNLNRRSIAEQNSDNHTRETTVSESVGAYWPSDSVTRSSSRSVRNTLYSASFLIRSASLISETVASPADSRYRYTSLPRGERSSFGTVPVVSAFFISSVIITSTYNFDNHNSTVRRLS